jgi:hypothetical protein
MPRLIPFSATASRNVLIPFSALAFLRPIRCAIKSLVSHNWTVTVIGVFMVGIGVAWAIWKLGWRH